MTRDDIIKLAREAGMERTVAVHENGCRTVELMHPDLLVRFAALVAAAEREACAKVATVFDKTFQTGGVIAHAIRAGGQA